MGKFALPVKKFEPFEPSATLFTSFEVKKNNKNELRNPFQSEKLVYVTNLSLRSKLGIKATSRFLRATDTICSIIALCALRCLLKTNLIDN